MTEGVKVDFGKIREVDRVRDRGTEGWLKKLGSIDAREVPVGAFVRREGSPQTMANSSKTILLMGLPGEMLKADAPDVAAQVRTFQGRLKEVFDGIIPGYDSSAEA